MYDMFYLIAIINKNMITNRIVKIRQIMIRISKGTNHDPVLIIIEMLLLSKKL